MTERQSIDALRMYFDAHRGEWPPTLQTFLLALLNHLEEHAKCGS